MMSKETTVSRITTETHLMLQTLIRALLPDIVSRLVEEEIDKIKAGVDCTEKPVP